MVCPTNGGLKREVWRNPCCSNTLAYVITEPRGRRGGDRVIGMTAGAITGVQHSHAACPTQPPIAHESAIRLRLRLSRKIVRSASLEFLRSPRAPSPS